MDILLLVSKALSSHFVVVRYCYNKNKHTKKEKNKNKNKKKRILIALPFVNNNCGDATFFLERSLKRIKQLRMRMCKQYSLLRSEREDFRLVVFRKQNIS